MRLAITIAVFALLHLSPGGEARAGSWTFKSGESLPGDPVSFDFGKKTVTVTNPLTGKNTVVPTKNLSVRSRQRLLFSPLFHRGEGDDPLWPEVKRSLLLRGLIVPVVILFAGFWVSGWLIGRKFNPVLAVIGFIGSWVIVAIFTVCYAFLKIRLHGGMTTTLVGVGFTLIFTPLFVSAVYGCRYLRGAAVFFFHLVAGLSLLSIGMVAIETIAGREKVDAWWSAEVFEPLGLMGPPAGASLTPPGRDSAAS
jgi:hypothetical protein